MFTLPSQSVLRIAGSDRKAFLQGLITNNIEKLSPSNPLYTCMLTPQGKYLFDFFLYEKDEAIYVDIAESRKAVFIQKLTLYKLRSNVTIEDVNQEYDVAIGTGLPDPRNAGLGLRDILSRHSLTLSCHSREGGNPSPVEAYDYLRISLCIPDGEKDLIPDGSFPLQNRMEEMQAIDFNKGCYVGQEVTARSKHRGQIRKNLFTVQSTGDFPPAGTAITFENKEVGQLRSSNQDLALAQLDIETAEKRVPLFCNGLNLSFFMKPGNSAVKLA